MIKRIYLDMDGVIADFVDAAAQLWGKRAEHLIWPQGEWSIHVPLGLENVGEMWKKVDRAGVGFWSSLAPYPWRDKLWRLCESVADTVICTSPSNRAESSAGKVCWLQNWKGQSFRSYILIPKRKYLLSFPGTVLIDDNEKNIEEFEMKGEGGKGILFPRPWNRLHAEAGSPIKYVAKRLTKLHPWELS